jgi:protein-disulfide isomerase
LDQVAEKYGDDVNIVFAHFPLSFHQNAQKAGEALECAGKIGGEEGFFAFKKAFFAKAGDSNLNLAKDAATEVGIDATELETCVNGGEFAQKVKDQMAYGRSLGVTGTPGNIVMNNETLEFQKVSGAVPATAFDPAITAYLN